MVVLTCFIWYLNPLECLYALKQSGIGQTNSRSLSSTSGSVPEPFSSLSDWLENLVDRAVRKWAVDLSQSHDGIISCYFLIDWAWF